MNKIENNAKKVDLMSKILFANIIDNKKTVIDDYADEAYEIVDLIDGIQEQKLVAQLIEDYYLQNAINDVWSDYESISDAVASEYMEKTKNL